MQSPEPTILTRWGRLTGAQWLQRRYLHELDEWLTDEALHYIYNRIPYHDHNRQEIVDLAFRDLLETDPSAAATQLLSEERQYLEWLVQHQEHRKQEEAQAEGAKTRWVHGRHRRGRKRSESRPQPTQQMALIA
jgi:hypothetical protein